MGMDGCAPVCLQVLSRVFLVQPSAFAALLNGAVTAGPPGQAIENAGMAPARRSHTYFCAQRLSRIADSLVVCVSMHCA